jgi:hypothetical protein
MLIVDADQFFSINHVLHLSFINNKKQTDTMYKFKLLVNCLLLAATLTILSSSSCKKDDDPVPKTKTELLTLGGWKLVKGEFRTNPSLPWTDGTGILQPCEKDDVNLYKTDTNYEINEGASKCTASDPQVYEVGKWAFQNNETELKTTETGSPTSIIWGIEQISETTLILTTSENVGGTVYYVRSTMGH